MSPALLVPFMARFGPWFGRAAAAAPSLLTNVVTKLRAADPKAIVGNSVQGVVAYARSSPATALLTVTTLASLGVSVADLLGGDKAIDEIMSKGGVETSTFLNSMIEMEKASSANPIVYEATVKAADISATLSTGLAVNATQLAVSREVLTWARQFFGSPSSALVAHRLLQAFMEMNHADVGEGFKSLKTN